MARTTEKRAKRALRPNPREERNLPYHAQHNPRGIITEEINLRPKKRVELIPRNIRQEDYIDALMDDSKDIVFAMGSAGTGKTMLATQYAIQCLQTGTHDKVIITRPAVGADGENLGALPGDILQKMQPWVLPIIDYFEEVYSPQQVVKMLQNKTIDVSPLSYMRGRTLKNAIIIADELQNATPSQMKMLLTRIGEGSKMVCTGDLNQHDRNYQNNGLKDFVERLKNVGSNKFAVVEFSREHIERHPIIDEVLRIYGEED